MTMTEVSVMVRYMQICSYDTTMKVYVSFVREDSIRFMIGSCYVNVEHPITPEKIAEAIKRDLNWEIGDVIAWSVE